MQLIILILMLPWSCLDKVFSFLLLPVCLLYFYLQFLYFSSFSSILSRYYWIRCWSISWRWRHWWIAICSGEPFIRNWMPRWYVQLTIEFWNWDNYWWWACFYRWLWQHTTHLFPLHKDIWMVNFLLTRETCRENVLFSFS